MKETSSGYELLQNCGKEACALIDKKCLEFLAEHGFDGKNKRKCLSKMRNVSVALVYHVEPFESKIFVYFTLNLCPKYSRKVMEEIHRSKVIQINTKVIEDSDSEDIKNYIRSGV